MNAPAGNLEREIQALRARLEEAEDMRRAISCGEVDGFVVGPSEDDKKVLLLAGAYSRYRQLIDEMEHGTVTVDTTGAILFANQRFARIVGAGLGELHRARLADYLHADDRAAVAALLTSPADDTDGIVVRVMRPTGVLLRARLSLASTWESYATLVLADLSQEDMAEEARQTVEAIRRGEVDAFVMGDMVVTLTSSRDPYHMLADRIQQGALTLSAAGRIVYVNSRFARMVGHAAERLVGTALETYALATDRGALATLLSPLSRNGSQGEVRLRRADGESIHALISVAPLADGTRMCLLTDLTDLKRHQASDERTRRFLGMLAHEFRDMLNGMHASIETLKRRGLDPECVKALESIERQSDKMRQVVNDLRMINPLD
jgi:PAS domain S-box-containing protein